MRNEKAIQIINDYINDEDNLFADELLTVDSKKGIKVINWTEGKYGWNCTYSYYTKEQVEKLKNNSVFGSLENTSLFDFCYEEENILHLFSERRR